MTAQVRILCLRVEFDFGRIRLDSGLDLIGTLTGIVNIEELWKTRPGVQQCQAQRQVFCPWLGLI